MSKPSEAAWDASRKINEAPGPIDEDAAIVQQAIATATADKDRQIAELVEALENTNREFWQSIPSDADDWPLPPELNDLANRQRRLANKNDLLISRHKEPTDAR